jgi:hypothetical protein
MENITLFYLNYTGNPIFVNFSAGYDRSSEPMIQEVKPTNMLANSRSCDKIEKMR